MCNPHYREGGLLGDFPVIAEIYIYQKMKTEARGAIVLEMGGNAGTLKGCGS